MELPKRASLEGIPRELRQEIFSYLLSHQATLKCHDSLSTGENKSGISLTYAFHTAILRVNRSIALESADCFRRENRWVLIDQKPESESESEPRSHRHRTHFATAVSALDSVIPVVTLKDGLKIRPRVVFKIVDLCNGYREPSRLIEASHLRHFVTFVNIQHKRAWFDMPDILPGIVDGSEVAAKREFTGHVQHCGLKEDIKEVLGAFRYVQPRFITISSPNVLGMRHIILLLPKAGLPYSMDDLLNDAQGLFNIGVERGKQGFNKAALVDLLLARFAFDVVELTARHRARIYLKNALWQNYFDASAILTCHLRQKLLDQGSLLDALQVTREEHFRWSRGRILNKVRLSSFLPSWNCVALKSAKREIFEYVRERSESLVEEEVSSRERCQEQSRLAHILKECFRKCELECKVCGTRTLREMCLHQMSMLEDKPLPDIDWEHVKLFLDSAGFD